MPAHRLIRSMTISALAAFAPGCATATATAPADVPARYALVALDGQSVPALADTGSVNFGFILADTIAFDGNGGVDRRFVFRRVQVAPASEVTQPVTLVASYRLGPGDRVEIGRFTPCGIAALCARNEIGTISATNLELSGAFYGYGKRLTFRRID